MFKVGDRVVCVKPRSHLEKNRKYTISDSYRSGPNFTEFVRVEGHSASWYATKFKLVGEEEMTKYKTGRWHNWNGTEECPLPEGTKAWIACFDSSSNSFHSRNLTTQGYSSICGGINVYPWKTEGIVSYNPYRGTWKHRDSHTNVIAFYVESYSKKAKEMTVEEIQKQLGFKVKVVEG